MLQPQFDLLPKRGDERRWALRGLQAAADEAGELVKIGSAQVRNLMYIRGNNGWFDSPFIRR